MQRRNKQAGFTLTELAIVLAALGLLVGAIWAVVGVVWGSYRVNTVREELFQLVQNVQGHYAQSGQLPGSDGADITSILDADDLRLIPVSMRTDRNNEGSDINHAFASTSGGSFSIIQKSGRVFRTKLTNLDQEACQKMLMQFPLLLPELGIRGLEAPEGTFMAIDPNNPAEPSTDVELPFSVATALDHCPDTKDNTVIYDFTIYP